jgi:hypothetical protein
MGGALRGSIRKGALESTLWQIQEGPRHASLREVKHRGIQRTKLSGNSHLGTRRERYPEPATSRDTGTMRHLYVPMCTISSVSTATSPRRSLDVEKLGKRAEVVHGPARRKWGAEMIGKLMKSDGAGTTLVVVLCVTIAVLTANGPGRPSLGRILSGALSNPAPQREVSSASAHTGQRPARAGRVR